MSDQMLKTKMAAATDRYLALGVDTGTTEDADNRFELQADGQMMWGDGTNAQDVVLARTAPGILSLTTGAISGGAPVVLTTTTTITQALHAGKVLLMTGTGAAKTQTLPAATGTGARYLFVVGAVNTSNHVINVANATDVMKGVIITASTAETPDLAQPWVTTSSSDTVTLNGTTTGGQAIGDYVEIIDVASGTFMVRGVTTSSGSEATPFSAAVS